MRRLLIGIIGLGMAACTYSERADWDSGARARNLHLEEARQEEVESTRNQFPTAKPGTERPQPF